MPPAGVSVSMHRARLRTGKLKEDARLPLSPNLTRGHKAGFFMALQEVCRSPQDPSDEFP